MRFGYQSVNDTVFEKWGIRTDAHAFCINVGLHILYISIQAQDCDLKEGRNLIYKYNANTIKIILLNLCKFPFVLLTPVTFLLSTNRFQQPILLILF